MNTAARRAPAIFVTHGGGPMPILNPESGYKGLWERHAREMFPKGTERPAAIVVVSAHYEASGAVCIGGGQAPKMLYDYGGFPAESYKLQYPAPGSPEIAEEAAALLKAAGIKARIEPDRQYDHGVFVPLWWMFPKADIPVIPISVQRSQDPMEHIAIGRALSPLRDKNILFVGSGSSNHNFAYLFGQRKPADRRGVGAVFHDKFNAVFEDAAASASEKLAELSNFLQWPGAVESQAPGQADHFMPLFTILGTSRYFGGISSKPIDEPAKAPHVAFTGDFDGAMLGGHIPFTDIQCDD